LHDVNIGIVRGTSYGRKFDEAVRDGTLQKIDLAHDIELNLTKLMHGRVVLIANYRYGVLEAARHLGLLAEIKEIAPPIESIPSYLAFTKQRDFARPRDDFEVALASMKQDGSYDGIVGQYPH
jgi:polar amino acid transport system substrate-binding protein